ncbi:RNA binding protein [Rhodotorula diobovata]|uniref:RNA binding protein n=1 Tax=Rhodotorula diobovata TaxID=5288 RepID=A0A5C5FXH1_9BASI|nr:RNA binding protein [Rhodotorula diobovata]
MDLDALRKAALSSKKRKRTPQPSLAPPHADADADEREEGEIDDDAHAGPSTPAPLPSAAGPPYLYHNHASHYPHVYAPSAAANGYAASVPLDAVKEESKRIIAELLTFGVPPDYLLSIGISRDILQTSFRELGLNLSLPPEHDAYSPYPPVPSISLSAHAHPFTPGGSASPAPTADLAALEALKRQELLARKAALSARNALSAQSLESELEDLFSASSTAPSPAPASPPAKGSKKSRKRGAKKRKVSAAGAATTTTVAPQLTSPAQKVHDLRDAIDHTEEVVDVPPAGPFAAAAPPAPSTSAGSTSTAGSIAAASIRSLASFPGAPAAAPSSSRARPLATDFEAEPATRLPAPSLSGARGMYAGCAGTTGYLPSVATSGAEASMVIDLSDSDESDREDAEGDEGGDANGDREDPGASARGSKAPSPSGAAGGAGVDAAEVERRKRLEEKEQEIQRMMARIAEMERKKKAAKGKKPDGPQQGTPEPVSEATVTAQPEAEEVKQDAAMKEVAPVLEAGAAAEAGAGWEAGAVATESAPVEEAEAAAVVKHKAPPLAPHPSVFRPYASSLARFPLIRASATAPDMDATGDGGGLASADGTGNAGLASWVARKRGVDTSKRLCKAEAGGGKCHDDKCRSVHVSSFEPTADELAEYQSLCVAPSSSSSSTDKA